MILIITFMVLADLEKKKIKNLTDAPLKLTN